MWFVETKGKSKLVGREKETLVEYINGDLLNVVFKDWRDADVILANTTCFDEGLMNKFCDRASKSITCCVRFEWIITL